MQIKQIKIKQIKKAVGCLLLLAMAFCLLSSPNLAVASPVVGVISSVENSGGFKDTANHWAAKSINRWTAYGIIKGESAEVFNPNGDLTRGALATILAKLLGLNTQAPNIYADVKPNAWYASGVLKCTAAGIMQGDGSNAQPDAKISRQESLVMIARAIGIKPAKTVDLDGFRDANQVAAWAAPYLTVMTQSGILTGLSQGILAPTANIDRASILTILDKAISDYLNVAGTYDKVVGSGVVVVAAPDVILQDTTISGSLLVAEGVGEGKCTLDKLAVLGNTTVRGGTSLVIQAGSALANLNSARAEGNLAIAVEDSAVETVLVEGGKAVSLEGSLPNLQIADSTSVTCMGQVKNVGIIGENANLIVAKNGAVENITTAKAATNLTVEGVVTAIATDAAKTTINNNGKIASLSLGKNAVGAKYVAGEASAMPQIITEKMTNLTLTTVEAEKLALGGGSSNPQELNLAKELKALQTFSGYLVASNYTPESWAAVVKAKALRETTKSEQTAKLQTLKQAVKSLQLQGVAKVGVDEINATMNKYFQQQNNSASHAITLQIDQENGKIGVCVFQPEIALTIAMQGSGMKSAFTDPPVLNLTMEDGSHFALVDKQNRRDPLGAAIFIADAIGTQYGIDPYTGSLADILALPANLREMELMLGCGSGETHTAPAEYNGLYTLYFYQSPLRLQQVELTLLPKAAKQLRPIATPMGALVWTSSNPQVATVSNTGMVTAVGKGTALISMGAEGYSGFPAQAIITVAN